MTLRAADIDNIRFATVDRGYPEAEVDEFVANVGISLAAAEAALAQASARTAAAAEGAAEASGDPVPVAARLLEFAHTAADEQLAAAHSEAERVVRKARAHADKLVADAHNHARGIEKTFCVGGYARAIRGN
jgi:DivIVA domain-containing protein